MPRFSAFAPWGSWAFSSQAPRAELVYRALKRAWGTGYNWDVGGHAEAKLYATARRIAAAALTLERGANQRDPHQVYEMLPAMERQYRLAPKESATIIDRRRVLAAKYLASRGSSVPNLFLSLTTLLGDDLIAIKQNLTDPAPTTPGDGPGTFLRDDVVERRFTLLRSITTLGTPVWFPYLSVLPAPHGFDAQLKQDQLKLGEEVVVQYGNIGLAEKVTIESVCNTFGLESLPVGVPDYLSAFAFLAQATFTKVKEAGCSLRVGPVPFWNSNSRYTLLLLKSAAARDTETRREVNDLMRTLMPGVSTWGIVEEAIAGSRSSGPFHIDGPLTSYLGTATISSTSF